MFFVFFLLHVLKIVAVYTMAIDMEDTSRSVHRFDFKAALCHLITRSTCNKVLNYRSHLQIPNFSQNSTNYDVFSAIRMILFLFCTDTPSLKSHK